MLSISEQRTRPGGQDGGVSRTETRRSPLRQGKEFGLDPESSGELGRVLTRGVVCLDSRI